MYNHPIKKAQILEAAATLGVTITDGPIQPGDMYLAGRNVAVHLLTCRKVDLNLMCIFPVENAYAYDIHECYKVMV